MVRSGRLMLVGSVAVAKLVAPPPLTLAVLTTLAAALPFTLTVQVIGGWWLLGASTSDRVQPPGVQLQPGPLTAVDARPAGRRSPTATVPMVSTCPTLLTVMV